ncbi:MAG TPA: PASTA domain-containing protein [Actinomycetota bacterium]|nr:PASTA domain-containing protein [Actinomycetota bacterium]
MRLMRDLVGETLSDRYRLVARIAGGGMGEVYRGQDVLLERPVAVKILQPSLAADPDLVERFKDEARAAARLTHPNIVSVHDWGAADEQTYYMVMEFVAGTDLRDLLVSRGSLAPAQAAEIMACVCDALAAAHAAGVVHRDVKPENVLIARNGRVKVADFGIAAVADADRTMPGGGIPGTLRYLSPEQASGRAASPASDVWAAGAVLSELLTGRPPQQGSGADLLRRRAIEPPVAPSTFDQTLPQALDEIVMKACALDPPERFDDAAEMAAALRRASVRSLPDAPPVDSLLDDVTGVIRLPDDDKREITRSKRRRRGRRIKVGAALVVLALLAFGAAKAVALLAAPARVDVPTLTGLPRADARAEAEEAGLELEIVGRDTDLDVPKGHVLSQDPADGTLLEGKAIAVVISGGLPKHEVPDLIGMKVDAATTRANVYGFEIVVTGEEFALTDPGEIIEQTPADGKLERGGKLEVVVSKGPQSIGVPNVEGLPATKAQKMLEREGFEVVAVPVYSNTVDLGIVVYTTPPGGSTAPEGSRVDMAVSQGPKYDEVTMPDVRGMTIDAATSELEGLGLRVNVVQSCGGGGTIVSETQPLGGTKIRENQLVDVFTC